MATDDVAETASDRINEETLSTETAAEEVTAMVRSSARRVAVTTDPVTDAATLFAEALAGETAVPDATETVWLKLADADDGSLASTVSVPAPVRLRPLPDWSSRLFAAVASVIGNHAHGVTMGERTVRGNGGTR